MPIEKQIVTGDYIDPTTGLRFVEDIRGNLHCCTMMMNNDTPTPTPPIEIPPINIPPIEIPPVEVNIPPIEVVIPPVTIENPYKNSTPIILQSTIKDFTWASTTNWNRINNSYGTGFVGYTTPFNKELHIVSIVISQSKNGEGIGSSNVGLFKAGNLIMSFPFVNELNYSFFQPYIVEHSTYIEFKYLPNHNKLQFSILAIGYLV